MRTNRIGLKLGAIIISLITCILLLLGVVADQLFASFFHAKMKGDIDELAAHFAMMAGSGAAGMEPMMIKMFAEFSDVDLYLVKADGNVAARSGAVRPADEGFISDAGLNRLFRGEQISKDYKDVHGETFFLAARSVSMSDGSRLAVYVLASARGMQESVGRVRSLLLLVGIGGVLLSIGFTYVVSLLLSRPLLQMEAATRSIAKGKLETRLAIRSRDEVGALAGAINDLAGELQRYRDTRQEFFANISHELRTPITYIEGYAKVLSDGLYETEAEKDRYLTVIYQECRRLSRLLNDLFELAKLEEGKLEFAREPVDLGEVAERAVQKVEIKAKEKGLALILVLAEGDLWLVGDGLRLEQIILNLLENAVRYTEWGEIRVDVKPDGDALLLLIEDAGVGIPEDELPYIFERFYRVEKSRSRQFGGTGLGLAIVKRLTEAHGGTIHVTSPDGLGTRFELRFPRHEKND